MSDFKHDSFAWLVELLAYWEGRVQPAQLSQHPRYQSPAGKQADADVSRTKSRSFALPRQ